MTSKKWFAPTYYKDFKCKCEKCRRTCCGGWKIAISQKEYFNLIGVECSNELHKRIESSFNDPDFPTPETYKYISYNWLGECPINKDGLCLLYKENLFEYLPKICRLYPRSFKEINGKLFMCLSSSCERVIEMLFEEKQFKIVQEEINEEPLTKLSIDLINLLLRRPFFVV